MKRSLISPISTFIVALAAVIMFMCTALGQTTRVGQTTPVQAGATAESNATQSPLQRKTAIAAKSTRLDWWHKEVVQSVTESDKWVSFDLETVLLDTLENSPRIESVSKRTSIAFEQIVQQDAMFDPNVLFESQVGRNNEPIGNELTTGGPPRLIEGTTFARAGIEKTGRRGTQFDLSQEIGTFNSNSKFVSPVDQGNARLAVSLTQPLLGRGGRVYNERLVTQACIDSRISWQEMRSEVEVRVSEVITAYWHLYELRCHLLQQTELLQRGEHIQQVVLARRDFDTGRVELAKTRQRVARRIDRLLQIEAGIARQQTRLASLIGSELLQGESGGIEFVPKESPQFPRLNIDFADALLKGIENRPEVRAAVQDLEAAGLAVNVTRAELDPELSAIVAGFVGGLDGNYGVFDAWTNQFTRGGPGVSAGVKYEMPYGRRAARARYREAQLRYQQRNQQLREAMQLTTADIDTALINVNTALAQQSTKKQVLVTAIEEENILTRRWEMMGDEGGLLGVVLENLLDAQQRRTEAEREWSSAQVRYLTSIVALQRAMGTLLITEGIHPVKDGRCGIHFVQDAIVPDAKGFISPSDITPAVEAEIDAAIEADAKPQLKRDLGNRDEQESSAVPRRLPNNSIETRGELRQVPPRNGVLRPKRLSDPHLGRRPGLSAEPDAQVMDSRNAALPEVKLPEVSRLPAAKRLPAVAGTSNTRLPVMGHRPEVLELRSARLPSPPVVMARTPPGRLFPIRLPQAGSMPSSSVGHAASVPRASLRLPKVNRDESIRWGGTESGPRNIPAEMVPASTRRLGTEAYPRVQAAQPKRLPKLHSEIQR